MKIDFPNKQGKGIPLEDVVVELQHEKIHAEDCAECETKSGKIDKIFKTVELTGQFSDEQEERLFEIAEKCPINRTLKTEIVVKSRLK
jgi:putative redox protein